MKTHWRISLHYLFRGLLTGGFSLYIIYLVQTEALIYYIAPRMQWMVQLSAVVLALIAVYFLFATWLQLQGRHIHCDCDHTPKKSLWKNTIAYSFFLAPLLFGYFIPDTVMGSHVVDQKGIQLNINETSIDVSQSNSRVSATTDLTQFSSDDPFIQQYSAFAQQLMLREPIIVEEHAYLETSTAIDLFMQVFQGKSIQIDGFVYVQDGMSPTQFVVARLAMECCSADATPYGFMVEWPEAAQLLPDTWVRVSGVIGASQYFDTEIVTIIAEEIEQINAPESPYVYPNYDLLEQVYSF
jgi:putative membrane protein